MERQEFDLPIGGMKYGAVNPFSRFRLAGFFENKCNKTVPIADIYRSSPMNLRYFIGQQDEK